MPCDPAAHGVGVVLLHAALLHGPGELLLDPAEALVERGLVHLAHHHVVAGLRGHLRDPVTHEAAAEHPHLLYLH